MKSTGARGEEKTSLLDYIARRLLEIKPESGEELQGLDALMQAERVDINDVRQHVDTVQVIAPSALAVHHLLTFPLCSCSVPMPLSDFCFIHPCRRKWIECFHFVVTQSIVERPNPLQRCAISTGAQELIAVATVKSHRAKW